LALAMGRRPSVADWGGGMSASCTAGPRTMDDRIMCCGIISSCQSSATSDIVKRCCSWVWVT